MDLITIHMTVCHDLVNWPRGYLQCKKKQRTCALRQITLFSHRLAIIRMYRQPGGDRCFISQVKWKLLHGHQGPRKVNIMELIMRNLYYETSILFSILWEIILILWRLLWEILLILWSLLRGSRTLFLKMFTGKFEFHGHFLRYSRALLGFTGKIVFNRSRAEAKYSRTLF